VTDSFNLQRFIDAQNGGYAEVCDELRRGRKTGHWMWFIFPQLEGLGHSFMARKYAISGLPEARAYLEHPVLGARLRECTELVIAVEGRSVHEIFGDPDDMKFRSSMTLFAAASEDPGVFDVTLQKYFGGKRDVLTIERLRR